MCLCTCECLMPRKSEEGIRSPGTGVKSHQQQCGPENQTLVFYKSSRCSYLMSISAAACQWVFKCVCILQHGLNVLRSDCCPEELAPSPLKYQGLNIRNLAVKYFPNPLRFSF